MSLANPTALNLGRAGELNGRRYTVRGRVVLRADIDGEAYFWNEYNLVDALGRAVTLVYEESEAGSPWKLFEDFTPSAPLTAREAASKRAGDEVRLDGRVAQVSLVDESEVVTIEGRAPEGVETGDVANYFNADVGDEMIVVSWSGEEVEYFRGREIPARVVEAAFQLPATRSTPSFLGAAAGGDRSRQVLVGVIIFVLFAAGFGLYSTTRDHRTSRLPPPQPAPVRQLADGAQGTLEGRHFTLQGHTLTAVSRLGKRFERREYRLVDDAGQPALLVNCLGGNPAEWHLLRPLESPRTYRPEDAAAVKVGATVSAGGGPVQVLQVFLARAVQSDGRTFNDWGDAVHYGFIARGESGWCLARWNEREVQWFTGRAVPEKDVLAAFGVAASTGVR